MSRNLVHVDLGISTLKIVREAEAVIDMEGGMKLVMPSKNGSYFILALNS